MPATRAASTSSHSGLHLLAQPLPLIAGIADRSSHHLDRFRDGVGVHELLEALAHVARCLLVDKLCAPGCEIRLERIALRLRLTVEDGDGVLGGGIGAEACYCFCFCCHGVESATCESHISDTYLHLGVRNHALKGPQQAEGC
jgi:hypothetical protein